MTDRGGTAERPASPEFGVADARECVGNRIEEIGGGNVGRVQGLLVDAVDGSPTWLVVRLGRIGRRAAIPARFVAAAAGHAWAAFPRSWIRSAAEIEPNRGLTPEQERRLLAHYGIPLDSGRAADLGIRPEGAPSSIPDA
jgi:hypothetical protein